MAYLLDQCLLSEVWKPAPNGGVIDWLSKSCEEELFLSVLTLGELKKGIDRLPNGKKRDRITSDYVSLRARFSSRVLPITEAVAERWGALAAAAGGAGKHLHVVDGLTAATALVAGLTIVTRNVGDFAPAPVPVLDPWT